MLSDEFTTWIKKHASQPATYSFVGILCEAVKELQQRIRDLEAQPFLKDAGTWRHGSTYRVGDVAQFKGARWVCTKAHTGSGAPDHSCFQLWEKTGGHAR